MSIKERLAANAALVEEELAALTRRDDPDFLEVLQAERYSLLAKAKRIRPTLVLEFCRLFGGEEAVALRFAAAVEMVHTYSLIHDDLPCMDDDDLRRGRPTCHKVYGEATALLAGDGLLTRAFDVIATAEAASDAAARDAVAALAMAAGSFGMIGGQVIDLKGERERLSEETLYKLHSLKTGQLIAVSAELGCIAAGLSRTDERTRRAKQFAAGIGLAFQVIDDLLDATENAEMLGKSAGSDAASHKTTFLSYHSTEEARALAREMTALAKNEIADFAGSEVLTALADYLIDRRY